MTTTRHRLRRRSTSRDEPIGVAASAVDALPGKVDEAAGQLVGGDAGGGHVSVAFVVVFDAVGVAAGVVEGFAADRAGGVSVDVGCVGDFGALQESAQICISLTH
jgi:hypothetical protein